MELTKARPSTQLAPPNELSKLSKIVMLLGTLAIRRQAKLTDQDYQVFASDLEHFDIIDLEAAMLGIAKKPRGDGETAFPEIQAIVEAAQKAKRDRRIAAERERRMADEAAERRRRETHPEDFIADDEIKAMADKLSAKIGFEQPKEIVITEPVMLACPHCSASLPVSPNIRFWSSEELRAHADTLDELQRMADKNRVSQ